MPQVLRVTSMPPVSELIAIPQIVIVDETGPAVPLGPGTGITLMVGEFVKGAFSPQEVTSQGQISALYGQNISRYLSQGVAGRQNGGQLTWGGNGLLHLLGLTFRRLALMRVDTEMVATDGGTTKGTVAVTVTVATSDQDGSSNTNKAIVIPGGTRFANAALSTAVSIVSVSGDFVIPKGTTLTTNAVTVNVPVFAILVVEPVVATASAALTTVIDSILPNVDPATTITAVTNATTLWPPGTGTTLSTRIETRYQAAISKTLPGASDTTSNVTVISSARNSTVIRQALAANAALSSLNGRARVCSVAAPPAASSSAVDALAAVTAANGLVAADNYPQPADRVMVAFPHVQVTVPDFGNIAVTINPAMIAACAMSTIDNEHNPGEANPNIQNIASLEDAFVQNPLVAGDYKQLLANGVCPLQKDRAVGWWFVDGITAANQTNFPTRRPMKRRRMADEIEDGLIGIAAPYQKQPATTERVQGFGTNVTTYLEGLLSPEQPGFQRIAAYFVNLDGGDTKDNLALGIKIVLVYVQILPTMDTIVYRAQIGETVTVPTSQAA